MLSKKNVKVACVAIALIIVGYFFVLLNYKKNRIEQLNDEGYSFYYKNKLEKFFANPYKIECEFPTGAKAKNVFIPAFESLSEIVIWNQYLNEKNLQNLLKNPKLEKIDLRGCSLQDVSISYKLNNLHFLRVHKTNISDEILKKILDNAPNLEVLIADNTNISGKSISSINKLNKLTEINLHNTKFSLIDLKALKNYSQFTIVSNNIHEAFQEDND